MRTKLRETTAATILAAAEEVFAEQGLHEAHMGDIAARAGVAVGTLYNHFKDRDALLAGLLQTRTDELIERFDATLAAHAGSNFTTLLRAVLSAHLGYAEAHYKFHRVVMQGEVIGARAAFPCASAIPPLMLQKLYLRVEKLVKRGIREGALRPALADLYPTMLMSMIRGTLMRSVYAGVERPFFPVDQLVEFFFHGAAAGRASKG